MVAAVSTWRLRFVFFQQLLIVPIVQALWLPKRLEPPSEKAASGDAETLLFIGSISAPGHVERRQEIRNSWMKWSFLQGPDPPVVAKFIVGNAPENSDDAKLLEEDQQKNDDFVRLPIREDYHNLVNKTVAYLSWFAFHGTARYVMKLDDDTFPNLNLIVPLLQLKIRNEKTHLYGGALLKDRRSLSWGRWAQDPAVYNATYYPTYAAGPAYLLGADLAKLAFKEHLEEHLLAKLDNEDVNVGVWIHKENNSIPVDYQNFDAEEEGCRPGVPFACNLELGELACMWDRKTHGDADFCCKHELSRWEDRNKGA